MAKEQYIAMSRGRCPGLWTYYEFFSTLDDDNETTQGDWKQFAKKDEAVDYLYKHFVPVDEYPTNKFTEQAKGFDSDTFFKGRDGRTWMLDPEGFHIVYCCINAHDNDYGIGIHWANEIELSLPVSRVNTAESEMTRDIAQAKAIEGALRDALRFGKNRVCIRTDADRLIEKLNGDLRADFNGYVPHYRQKQYHHHQTPFEAQWKEIHDLISHLMSVNIQKVDKTDKNYHRVRKLASEG